jgi:hypothetical protein
VHPGGSSRNEVAVHRLAFFCLVTILTVSALVGATDLTASGSLDRNRDPLVLEGSLLPALAGTDPSLIVASLFLSDEIIVCLAFQFEICSSEVKPDCFLTGPGGTTVQQYH